MSLQSDEKNLDTHNEQSERKEKIGSVQLSALYASILPEPVHTQRNGNIEF
jgi:hypothetical protein